MNACVTHAHIAANLSLRVWCLCANGIDICVLSRDTNAFVDSTDDSHTLVHTHTPPSTNITHYVEPPPLRRTAAFLLRRHCLVTDPHMHTHGHLHARHVMQPRDREGS
uniref:Uncharacterized protein n=1 Tax=Vitrella brassicaformis TaxID=1169539 RepID=A0A7S1PG91_9ALVE